MSSDDEVAIQGVVATGDGGELDVPGQVGNGVLATRPDVPELWSNEDGSLRKVQEIPAPPPRKPPPLRNSSIAPWMLASRQPEQAQEASTDQGGGELMDPPDEYQPPSGMGTPRSATNYSQSVTSATHSVPYSVDSRPTIDINAGNEGSGVTLSQLEEFLAVKKGMRMACGTLPFTFLIWMSYFLVILNVGETEDAFNGSTLVKQSIEEAMAYKPTGVMNGTKKFGFYTMQDAGDITWWTKTALLPVLDPSGFKMSGTQKIVGFARVTQIKGAPGECKDLSANQKIFYPGLCYPKLQEGALLSSFGPYQVDDAFVALQPPRKPGEFEAWLDAGRDMSIMESRVQNLIDHKWIDLITQEVAMDALFVNLQLHSYSRVEIRIKIWREGMIEPKLTIKPIKAEVVTHWSHVFSNICFVIVLFFQLSIFLQQGLREHGLGLIKLHLKDPWTWLDVFLILSATVVIIMGVTYQLNMSGFTDKVFAIGQIPEYDVLEAPAARKIQAILENRKYREQVSDLFSRCDGVLELADYIRLGSAWYAVAICLRFYRGFTGQPRTSVILQAVMYMTPLFMHYLIILGTVFGNFALSGYILFGEQDSGWATFGDAVTSLMKLLQGEFDYNQLRNVAPISAMIWWWTFYIAVVIVLSKCLTAAVLQRFMEVRQALGEPGLGLPSQITSTLRNAWYARTYEGSLKSVPDEDLLHMLSADVDPAEVKKLTLMMRDRRLRNRDDLAKAEKDVKVDVEFLVERGMDPVSAERLLDRCAHWAGNIAMTTSATNRLMLLIAKQMNYITTEVERMQRKVRARIDRAAQSADRVDVKHAKCTSLAKRLRRAQKVPHGWTAHHDDAGRRYLRHEESGLTSWNLPRGLI